jgi:hypothetical protein
MCKKYWNVSPDMASVCLNPILRNYLFGKKHSAANMYDPFFQSANTEQIY